MNDLDELTDRLHELGQRAPVPAADPLLDIRRGRSALRRRHARSAAGVTTALVAVGVSATSLPALNWSGGSGDTVLEPAAGPSTVTAPTPNVTPTSAAKDPCTITEEADGELSGPAELLPSFSDPEIIAAEHVYQQAAATILDPSGKHIDLSQKYNEVVGGGGSFSCDPKTGPRLTGAGTKIGWASGDALGLIGIDVALTEEAEKPLVDEARWSAYNGELPDGVTKARVADHSTDGGGHSVVVERTDGLTVAITTSATWGNNMPPGSAPATDLPGIDKLLELAASPQLTFPGP